MFAEEWIRDLLFTGNKFEFGSLRILQQLAIVRCRLAKDVVERLVLTTDGEVRTVDCLSLLKFHTKNLNFVDGTGRSGIGYCRKLT